MLWALDVYVAGLPCTTYAAQIKSLYGTKTRNTAVVAVDLTVKRVTGRNRENEIKSGSFVQTRRHGNPDLRKRRRRQEDGGQGMTKGEKSRDQVGDLSTSRDVAINSTQH